jgi:hypothetical protein
VISQFDGNISSSKVWEVTGDNVYFYVKAISAQEAQHAVYLLGKTNTDFEDTYSSQGDTVLIKHIRDDEITEPVEEASGIVRDNELDIVIDYDNNLMWEDGEHTISNTLTWVSAYNYCDTLETAGYTNWRLPHSTMNSDGEGELKEIRQDAEADIDNTIISPFEPILQSDNIAYWSDEANEDNDAHIVHFFSASSFNADFMYDIESVYVRCVRDIE